MLAQQDVILIKAKMKILNLTHKGLAKKIHVNISKLDKVLNHGVENLVVEERLIKWLAR